MSDDVMITTDGDFLFLVPFLLLFPFSFFAFVGTECWRWNDEICLMKMIGNDDTQHYMQEESSFAMEVTTARNYDYDSTTARPTTPTTLRNTLYTRTLYDHMDDDDLSLRQMDDNDLILRTKPRQRLSTISSSYCPFCLHLFVPLCP
jgi:hypothetical protein